MEVLRCRLDIEGIFIIFIIPQHDVSSLFEEGIRTTEHGLATARRQDRTQKKSPSAAVRHDAKTLQDPKGQSSQGTAIPHSSM